MKDEFEQIVEGGALERICDFIGDIVTGIPVPIRKNAWKAYTRLCTAAVEYPVALIENAVAEQKAESRSRIKLINVSADQIVKQMQTDPEYARAAATKFAQKTIRERANVDRVAAIAATELVSKPGDEENVSREAEAVPIRDERLNIFEDKVAPLSSDQMQHLFGKILVGEIGKPDSYSIKTIKMMAHLDNKATILFQILCSLAAAVQISKINGAHDAGVISLGRHGGSNSLAAYGLSFSSLNMLEEHDLIILDYNSYFNYRLSVVCQNNVALPFIFRNEPWGLLQKVETAASQSLNIHGIALSFTARAVIRRRHNTGCTIRRRSPKILRGSGHNDDSSKHCCRPGELVYPFRAQPVCSNQFRRTK